MNITPQRKILDFFLTVRLMFFHFFLKDSLNTWRCQGRAFVVWKNPPRFPICFIPIFVGRRPKTEVLTQRPGVSWRWRKRVTRREPGFGKTLGGLGVFCCVSICVWPLPSSRRPFSGCQVTRFWHCFLVGLCLVNYKPLFIGGIMGEGSHPQIDTLQTSLSCWVSAIVFIGSQVKLTQKIPQQTCEKHPWKP